MKLTVAEFFSGCGGFSRGFTQSGKFNVVLGNDIKPEALHTFEFNHKTKSASPAIIKGDIRLISLENIRRALLEKKVAGGTLDCLIGGPPCQGFSQLRRAEERENGKIVKFRGYSKLAHDSRNDLVLRFLEIAEFLKPKTIVIENVPQMLRHGGQGRLGKLAESVVGILERDLGYSVAIGVLNAADYGVPQLRERAVFVASAVGKASLPDATHADPSSSDFESSGKKPWVSVASALGDLPNPSIDLDELGGGPLSLYQIKKRSTYASQMESEIAFPYNHLTRNYSERVLRLIKEMRPGETWDSGSARIRKRYEKLIQKASGNDMTNELAKKILIKEGKINPAFYKRYYWSAYTRLDWKSPALTITANSNFLGSGRFTHPEEMRGITMREAARLQSFDDDFRFITSKSDDFDTKRIGVGLDMIGEAVPPLLAKAIANKVSNLL
jgi:DNA (cytosine-5)-methyltransferase 1